MEFLGRFERFGKTSRREGYRDTVLLREIVEPMKGKLVADHLWTDCVQEFRKADPAKGGRFRFSATVGIYFKRPPGENGEGALPHLDFELSRISDVQSLPETLRKQGGV